MKGTTSATKKDENKNNDSRLSIISKQTMLSSEERELLEIRKKREEKQLQKEKAR